MNNVQNKQILKSCFSVQSEVYFDAEFSCSLLEKKAPWLGYGIPHIVHHRCDLP